jgi:hypothetical protein
MPAASNANPTVVKIARRPLVPRCATSGLMPGNIARLLLLREYVHSCILQLTKRRAKSERCGKFRISVARKLRRMHNLLKGLLVYVLFAPALGVAQTNTKTKQAPNDSLSKVSDWKVMDFRPLETNPTKVRLHLVTSWIPGEKRQGLLRYKLNAVVPSAILSNPLEIPATTEAEATILDYTFRCTISLELHDKDGFIIRTHIVGFKKIRDEDNARITGLLANDALQISAEEYRQFLNGSWSISWSCGY